MPARCRIDLTQIEADELLATIEIYKREGDPHSDAFAVLNRIEAKVGRAAEEKFGVLHD